MIGRAYDLRAAALAEEGVTTASRRAPVHSRHTVMDAQRLVAAGTSAGKVVVGERGHRRVDAPIWADRGLAEVSCAVNAALG